MISMNVSSVASNDRIRFYSEMLYTTAINTSVRRRGLLQQKVGRSMVSVFGNTNALCNNGWTDRDAV